MFTLSCSLPKKEVNAVQRRHMEICEMNEEWRYYRIDFSTNFELISDD